MKTKVLLIFIAPFLFNFTMSQSLVSNSTYYGVNVKSISIDIRYSVEIVKEGVKKYMKRLSYSSSFNPINPDIYKKVILKNRIDGSPYSHHNLKFKFEIANYNTIVYTRLVMIILDEENKIIDFDKYPSILEEGKLWLNEFNSFFLHTFLLEREMGLLQSSIVKNKEYRIKLIEDSLETILYLQNKIQSRESELIHLKSDLKAQQFIFRNSVDRQQIIVDSLQNKLDSLRKIPTK